MMIRTGLIALGLATTWTGWSGAPFAQTVDEVADSVSLTVLSEPAGASIFIQEQPIGLSTPATIRKPHGQMLIEVMFEGYEPLSKSLNLNRGQSATLHFVLKSFPPPPILPESLGLARLPILPLLNEKIAEQAQEKWSNLSETFTIVPLGQGLLAKALLPAEQQGSANAMIISGAALAVSTHFIAKAVGKRKLKWVRQRNEEIPAENDSAARHNANVDDMVTEANEQAMDRWLKENEQRGIVTVHIE